jgi:hypothetical protein
MANSFLVIVGKTFGIRKQPETIFWKPTRIASRSLKSDIDAEAVSELIEDAPFYAVHIPTTESGGREDTTGILRHSNLSVTEEYLDLV